MEESAQTIYLVLPSASPLGEGGEISDEELEAVAGEGTGVGDPPALIPVPNTPAIQCRVNNRAPSSFRELRHREVRRNREIGSSTSENSPSIALCSDIGPMLFPTFSHGHVGRSRA